MQLLSLTALALLSTNSLLAVAQDISNDDIPTACALVCSNLVAVSSECDRAFDDDDDELDCLCRATNAQQIISLCAACVSSNDDDDDDDDDNQDDDDNDVQELRSRCSFSTTSWSPSTTYTQAALTANTSGATTRLSGTATPTRSAGATQTSGITGSAGTTGAVATANAAPTKGLEGVGALAGAALLVAAAWV